MIFKCQSGRESVVQLLCLKCSTVSLFGLAKIMMDHDGIHRHELKAKQLKSI